MRARDMLDDSRWSDIFDSGMTSARAARAARCFKLA
jgi:hypothetical protein